MLREEEGCREVSTGEPAVRELYHVTTTENAEAILRDGFRDSAGWYGLVDDDGNRVTSTGVWLSDRPLDVNDAVSGDAVLVVELRTPLDDIADYELIEDGKAYREWCVPAEIVRRIATVRRIEQ
jgi:hypothetical protein